MCTFQQRLLVGGTCSKDEMVTALKCALEDKADDSMLAIEDHTDAKGTRKAVSKAKAKAAAQVLSDLGKTSASIGNAASHGIMKRPAASIGNASSDVPEAKPGGSKLTHEQVKAHEAIMTKQNNDVNAAVQKA